jgi:hypothetical protein
VRCDAAITSVASAKLVRETTLSGAGGQSVHVHARMASEAAVGGRGAVPTGGEAVLTPKESDEAVIIAAAWLLTHAR